MEKFTLAKYKITIEAAEAMLLPEFKGSMFRGGFGSTLKRICCIDRRESCRTCSIRDNCAYAYIFETAPLDAAAPFGGNSQIPRPYIFEPEMDGRRHYDKGDHLAFGLVLIGRAVDFLPYFIVALKELGHIGVTSRRRCYRLTNIEAVDNLSGERETIYEETSGTVFNRSLPITWHRCREAAADFNADGLTVDLLTPMRLKRGGRYLTDDLPMEVLIQNLTVRANALYAYHCGGAWREDLKQLRQVAAGADLAAKNLRWHEALRHSSRQRKTQSLSGLLGRATFTGDLKPLLPILILGSLIHAGSDSVFGCGKYDLHNQH